MAENKLEREYIIPLRKYWLRVPQYERTGKAVKAIKNFIAKHMKVADRDLDKVKLDVYFNNDLWFRGRASPPSKIKVKAIKEDGIVKVSFAEEPKQIEFLRKKNEKRHKVADKPSPITPKAEEKKEEKTEEQKTEEKEKEKSAAESNAKQADMQAKADKHITKASKQSHPQRMALKK